MDLDIFKMILQPYCEAWSKILLGLSPDYADSFSPLQGNTVDLNILQRPTAVTSFTGGAIAAIGAGKAHSLALTSDGRLLSFGLQTYGRLGRNAADVRSDAALPPGPVDGLEDIAIATVSGGESRDQTLLQEAMHYGLHTHSPPL